MFMDELDSIDRASSVDSAFGKQIRMTGPFRRAGRRDRNTFLELKLANPTLGHRNSIVDPETGKPYLNRKCKEIRNR